MKLVYLVSLVTAMLLITAAGTVLLLQNPFNADVVNNDIPSQDDELPPVGNMSFQDAVNAFGFEMFTKLADREDGNIFVSPYSIFTALAMTFEGAVGTTADQMAAVLQIEQDNASFHQYVQNLYTEFNADSAEYNLSTANALWVKENLAILDSYLTVIEEYYGGRATDVDFTDAETAAAIINSWVENQTNNLIKDLVPADALSPLTALVLTNAIYFKGQWQVMFDAANTTDRAFSTADAGEKMVETMQMVDTHDEFNYAETDMEQILELPYSGDDISMMVVLPKENASLDSILDTIDNDMLTSWMGSIAPREVDIYLPKFTVESSYSLVNTLNDMGMQLPFTTAADFSGITGAPDLFISNVLHKAYVDVNEEGTEAAAATAVIMELTAIPGEEEPPRVVFDCDHPFIYMIMHKQTGTVLFMGTMLDPSL